jgi:GDPmannose 4,6-dehydratase
MTAKRALICGISGQDGGYLARLLLANGYQVFGTSRDAEIGRFENLSMLAIRDRVQVLSMSTMDFRSVISVLTKVKPDEIYNLSGQSSVAMSFEQPVETMESIGIATLNLLEAIRFLNFPTRFYNAGSSECFGDTKGEPADEDTPFRPRSPYGMAKASAHWQVANYREAYDLFACSGILFNHDSPLRPERFVTMKIVAAACRIATGSKEKLRLGNIEVERDWGWTPEYVEAMWRMLQRDTAEDFVIATGVKRKLRDFVELAFRECGLKWQDHVVLDEVLKRPSDIAVSVGNAQLARSKLGWAPKYAADDVVRLMVAARRRGTPE